MHTLLGRLFRYVLWCLLLVIVFLLFLGLAKHNWDVISYIQALNQKSRSDAWQQGGVSGIFGLESGSQDVGLLSGGEDMQLATGASVSGDSVDVYDPSFEEDLNQIPQDAIPADDVSGVQTDFGFVSGDAGAQTTTSNSTTSAQLLELIKQREMNK